MSLLAGLFKVSIQTKSNAAADVDDDWRTETDEKKACYFDASIKLLATHIEGKITQ